MFYVLTSTVELSFLTNPVHDLPTRYSVVPTKISPFYFNCNTLTTSVTSTYQYSILTDTIDPPVPVTSSLPSSLSFQVYNLRHSSTDDFGGSLYCLLAPFVTSLGPKSSIDIPFDNVLTSDYRKRSFVRKTSPTYLIPGVRRDSIVSSGMGSESESPYSLPPLLCRR